MLPLEDVTHKIIGMAMEIDPVHTDGSPRRQYSHRPHAGFGLSTT